MLFAQMYVWQAEISKVCGEAFIMYSKQKVELQNVNKFPNLSKLKKTQYYRSLELRKIWTMFKIEEKLKELQIEENLE